MLDPAVQNSKQMLTSWLAAIPTSKTHIRPHSTIFQFVEAMILISIIFGPPLRFIRMFTLQLFVTICQASAIILHLCLALNSNIWICFTI
ncbi:hypothetical protein DFJ73DRAFT_848216 [Zopfochytrium polystomum]|nr:hypothetical protein DFJ73DRAFT_848216 [Zopfochytrium polystomum]